MPFKISRDLNIQVKIIDNSMHVCSDYFITNNKYCNCEAL